MEETENNVTNWRRQFQKEQSITYHDGFGQKKIYHDGKNLHVLLVPLLRFMLAQKHGLLNYLK
jgi:hypothetical protein